MLFTFTGPLDYLRKPTLEEWNAELGEGWWPGPDGSSMSTDTIFFCRIGITSPDWVDGMRYPANLHDFRYRVGRRLNLENRYRELADAEHYELLTKAVNQYFSRWNPVLYAARGRCWIRYRGLEIGGSRAFTQAAKARMNVRHVKWNKANFEAS